MDSSSGLSITKGPFKLLPFRRRKHGLMNWWRLCFALQPHSHLVFSTIYTSSPTSQNHCSKHNTPASRGRMRLVDFHHWSPHFWVEKSPAIDNMHKTISQKRSKTPTGWKVRLILRKSLHRLRDLSNTDFGTPQNALGFQWRAGVVTKGIIYKQADRRRFLHWFCTSTHLNTSTKHWDGSANCSQCYCCLY